jgi:hypothetical protein
MHAVIHNERVILVPQGDIMNKMYFTAVLILMGLFGVGVRAHAQDADAVVVSVPFEFVAGGATLSAGEYRIGRVSYGSIPELAIRSYDKPGAFLLPLTFDENAGTDNQPTLRFEYLGGKHFLSAIKTLDGVYTMPASREMVMLGKANSPSPSTSSASGGQ